MSRQIESRDGVEVYATQAGLVGIRQEPLSGEEQLVLIHPDDVDLLIKHIKEMQAEAYEIRKNPPDSRAA